jgi:hypothetical protein
VKDIRDRTIYNQFIDVVHGGIRNNHSIPELRQALNDILDVFEFLIKENSNLIDQWFVIEDFIDKIKGLIDQWERPFYARLYGRKHVGLVAMMKAKAPGDGLIEIYKHEDESPRDIQFQERERFVTRREFRSWEELADILNHHFASPPGHDNKVLLNFLQLLIHWNTEFSIINERLEDDDNGVLVWPRTATFGTRPNPGNFSGDHLQDPRGDADKLSLREQIRMAKGIEKDGQVKP